MVTAALATLTSRDCEVLLWSLCDKRDAAIALLLGIHPIPAFTPAAAAPHSSSPTTSALRTPRATARSTRGLRT